MKQSTLISFLILLLTWPSLAQEAPATFNNPILSGYHPDPSVCRVGNDYYLVNSTFLWFPGIPVYHSNDLVNWQHIGNAIDRPDQLNFDGLPDKLGVFAPTIRHHNGVFYIVNTCVACNMNFYITATNPAGPWSDPIWLPQAPGIDPSLFWDDDGRCYYTGVRGAENPAWKDQGVIFCQELDLEKQALVGPRHDLIYGHANNASYTEGPHLYKIDGRYLLMVSEGGTGMYHALTVHHSDSVFGPYVADYINPVLTHRHLGEDYPLHAIGHGDLVHTQNNEWWCVMLGKRRINKETTLARETFLAKVDFEGQTPIFNVGQGKVLMQQQRPNLPWTPVASAPVRDDFDQPALGLKWSTIRTPKAPFYSIDKSALHLQLSPAVADSFRHSSMVLQRVLHHRFEAYTSMVFSSKKANEQAGLVLYRASHNHYLLVKEKKDLVLIKVFNGEKTEEARVPFKGKEVVFGVKGHDLEAQFYAGPSMGELQPIGKPQSLIVIADGNGNMFHGPGVGIYGTANGKTTKATAVFNWFDYKPANDH